MLHTRSELMFKTGLLSFLFYFQIVSRNLITHVASTLEAESS